MLKLINLLPDLQAVVQNQYAQTWMVPKYKYIHTTYIDALKFDDSTWLKESYAVMKGEEVAGFIEVCMSRITYNAAITLAINFTDDTHIMGKAFLELIHSLIERQVHKIEWHGIGGNPILEQYEKICTRFGGGVEGIDRDGARLWDGTYTDVYHYGILMSEMNPYPKSRKYQDSNS